MKLFFTAAFTLISFFAAAQERKYLDTNWQIVLDSSSAKYYEEVAFSGSGANAIKTNRTYTMAGQLIKEESSNEKTRFMAGGSKEWFEDGKIAKTSNYVNGSLEGEFRSYYKTGELRRIDIYKDGKLIQGKCLTKAGADTTYYPHETSAEFPGGAQGFIRYLNNTLKYPAAAKKNYIQGKVLVQFVVNPDGSLSGTRISRPGDADLDAEALRVVSQMPNWKPAVKEGERVSQRMVIPVNFSLDRR
ncbi:energy transducer TonB [Adhaeribacter soli]|uniref:TonB family protein n=1 Tax=Adhaeribacter soli TaxID=2607655 RepID=A0A5N1J5W8_9BACT|nr:energy transducer TonB [Adhaeribacter soli]KAA9339983.1 TonB family protein [Adhaeribacter soli]